jgi:hypothetical protein
MISSITNSDLFDIEYLPLMKKRDSLTLSNIEGAFDYISHYSHFGEHTRKTQDLEKTLNRMKSTNSFKKIDSSLEDVK